MTDHSLLERIHAKQQGHYRDDHQIDLASLSDTLEAAAVEMGTDKISSITARVDKDDLMVIHNEYQNVLHTEAESLINRMHHRADMMRRRAQELDQEADELAKTKALMISGNIQMMTRVENAEDSLKLYAHIEPQRE